LLDIVTTTFDDLSLFPAEIKIGARVGGAVTIVFAARVALPTHIKKPDVVVASSLPHQSVSPMSTAIP